MYGKNLIYFALGIGLGQIIYRMGYSKGMERRPVVRCGHVACTFRKGLCSHRECIEGRSPDEGSAAAKRAAAVELIINGGRLPEA